LAVDLIAQKFNTTLHPQVSRGSRKATHGTSAKAGGCTLEGEEATTLAMGTEVVWLVQVSVADARLLLRGVCVCAHVCM